MSIKIGINGFGRIGRLCARVIHKQKDIELMAINDITTPRTMAHLFKHDSVHGIYPDEVNTSDDTITVGDQVWKVFAERDPARIPWREMGVDVVFECTGLFREREKASLHLEAGARWVIISAPAKNPDLTVVMGVNHEQLDPDKHKIISNASCTTNCLAPVVKVLHENFGLVKALMTTVHAYTNDQSLLDAPHKDLRRARAGAVSMVPTTTGAAKAVTLVMPELEGRLDGMAVRIPTPNVSLVDLVAQLEKEATPTEINNAVKTAAEGELKGILQYVDLPLVSMDFNGNPHSSCFDAAETRVVDGNLVKVLSWYDNEWGYSNRMVDLTRFMISRAD